VISIEELTGLAVRVLREAGVPEAGACTVADGVIYAEASGIGSHGLVRLPFLADQAVSGKIQATALPRLSRNGTALVRVDAGFGFGYVAAQAATEAVLDGLGKSPVVVAAVSNSHHFGVAGRYAEQIGAAGKIGIAVSGTFGAIAPVGGRLPLIGNPPISVAVPQPRLGPVVVDIAPAVIARGRIAVAAQAKEPIPPDWALGADGLPTTDPGTALSGTLRAIGGDKGVLFAVLADLLIAATTTSLLPGEAPSVFTPDGPPPRLGHLVIGLDPVRFGVADVANKIERYIAALTCDGAHMRVPGERRRAARERARRDGLNIPAALLAELRARI
jgi:(2R)-3-sulfolactate dehydrogenase (NADP+)